mmetsp:Transcript_35091/g.84109  ORF Transcript_35091/g.84109 Transcript_35091/m.84109 type:complete len:210 (-) Transcript_35091:1068-1697(-)
MRLAEASASNARRTWTPASRAPRQRTPASAVTIRIGSGSSRDASNAPPTLSAMVALRCHCKERGPGQKRLKEGTTPSTTAGMCYAVPKGFLALVPLVEQVVPVRTVSRALLQRQMGAVSHAMHCSCGPSCSCRSWLSQLCRSLFLQALSSAKPGRWRSVSSSFASSSASWWFVYSRLRLSTSSTFFGWILRRPSFSHFRSSASTLSSPA